LHQKLNTIQKLAFLKLIVIEIFPPFRNRLKGAKIEPLIIPQEQLDEFKAVLADPSWSDSHKSMMMRKLTGSCHLAVKWLRK
jgi:hypothetical protein